MNKRQQLEKLGNELNETFKQYIELAIQVKIEEEIERTLDDLIHNLEKISNGEEIVEQGLTANHKPEHSVIDMLLRYYNFLNEVEASDDEDEEYEDEECDEEYEDDEEEIIYVDSEKAFEEFLQLIRNLKK